VKTFKHSGDCGDIIFSLPTIRALGGGILYLDPNGGFGTPEMQGRGPNSRTKMNAATIASLRTLLSRVPYISEVRDWDGEAVDHNLDVFCKYMRFHNISDAHLTAFNLPSTERDRAWLHIEDPLIDERFPIIINRTLRYQSNYCWWTMTMPKVADKCAFVGTPFEHQVFEATVEQKVHYWPTPDALTLARVIAGAKQFIGNQSFAHAIAEAMKKNLVNEQYALNPACIFQRNGAAYV
jgi:hypothetical protein